jgi:hypothetical protein
MNMKLVDFALIRISALKATRTPSIHQQSDFFTYLQQQSMGLNKSIFFFLQMHALSDETVRRIASGQVITGVASAVKELLEYALRRDACC